MILVKWQCSGCGAIRMCKPELKEVLCISNSTCPQAYKQMIRIKEIPKLPPIVRSEPITESPIEDFDFDEDDFDNLDY